LIPSLGVDGCSLSLDLTALDCVCLPGISRKLVAIKSPGQSLSSELHSRLAALSPPVHVGVLL